MHKQKGFTIIELLVVIAIIAVLAGIVLINVASYINKGKDAAIKGNMNSALTAGASAFEIDGNYYNFITGPSTSQFNRILAAISSAGGSTVWGLTGFYTAYCLCSTLKSSTNTYCVDSTGYKKETAGTCASRCTMATGACTN